MKHLILFLSAILILQNAFVTNACDFTSCSDTKFHVCADETSFYRCDKTIPILDTTYKCPTGLNCVAENVRCSKGPPICENKCNICSPENGFACINKHEFNFCLDNKPIPEMKGSCNKLYCDSSIPSICNDKASTCSKEVPPPPTPAPTKPPKPTVPPKPTDPTPDEITKKCIALNKFGKFKGTDCKKYIYCRPLGSTIIGLMYKCPDETYFDCTTQQCGAKQCKTSPSCISIL